MRIAALRKRGGEVLAEAAIEDAQKEADFLLAHTLRLSHLGMGTMDNQTISEDVQLQYERALKQRAKRVPFSYIVGNQPFYHGNFEVTPDVLIPRPETELLVEKSWEILNDFRDAVVADVGTGSGCVALSLAPHPNVSMMYGVDISPNALLVARRNEVRSRLTRNVNWVQGDLLSQFGIHELDMVVANLPYIRTDVLRTLQPEVLNEPRIALDGGDRGVNVIERAIVQAEKALKPKGWMLLEIGFDQGVLVSEGLTNRRAWSDISVFNDLGGHPRVVQARKF